MSVCDSPEELATARTKLAQATPEALASDLAYWTIAAFDASDDYDQLRARIDVIAAQQHVARAWIGLIATELQVRRGLRERPTTEGGSD